MAVVIARVCCLLPHRRLRLVRLGSFLTRVARWVPVPMQAVHNPAASVPPSIHKFHLIRAPGFHTAEYIVALMHCALAPDPPTQPQVSEGPPITRD